MSALDNPELPPDLLVVSIVPILWTGVMRGRPANVCVSACEILHYAYEQFGIRSDLRAVELTTLDAEGDVVRHVADPSWDGNELDGHCILCLPDDCRFVDATVEQYRHVARLGLGVIMGRTAGVLSGTAEQREALLASTRLPVGTTLAVQRENLTLLYTLADDAATDAILNHPSVRDNVEVHRRAGDNLASLSLELLRKAKAVERVRAAPYARLQALLGTIGDAPAETDEAGDWYFNLQEDSGTIRRLRIDEISLPDVAAFYRSGSCRPLFAARTQQMALAGTVDAETGMKTRLARTLRGADRTPGRLWHKGRHGSPRHACRLLKRHRDAPTRINTQQGQKLMPIDQGVPHR